MKIRSLKKCCLTFFFFNSGGMGVFENGFLAKITYYSIFFLSQKNTCYVKLAFSSEADLYYLYQMTTLF